MSRYEPSREEVNEDYWRSEHREHYEKIVDDPESLRRWRSRMIREITEGFKELKKNRTPF